MTINPALFLLFLLNFTQDSQPITSLASVRTIRIEQMGIDGYAASFRLALAKEISARGFIVTESDYADAVLSGVLTVERRGDYYKSRCSAFLKNKDGFVLWQWEGKTDPPGTFDKFAFEPTGTQAFKAAYALEKDYKKALKKSKTPNEK